MRIPSSLLFIGILAACSPESPVPEGPSPIPPIFKLSDYFDCIGEKGLTQISAHRGGPVTGFPENALPTFENTVSKTGAFLEIDVATSSDGVLFLHHDDNLGRTTTGRGTASEKSWDQLRQLSLKDPSGNVTTYGLTRLEEALQWADGKAVFQIDIKRSTDYDDVARIVKNADAENRVILISYTDNSAAALASRFPDSMISVTVDEVEDIERLESRGLRRDQILAWTGTESPDPELTAQLQEMSVEVIFGTLGGRNSLDRQYEQQGNYNAYADLSALGVDMIATDNAERANEALMKNDRRALISSCHPQN